MRLKLKKTITAQEADALINKYYDGATTNTEEERLRRFLRQEGLPSKYRAEQAIFGYFEQQAAGKGRAVRLVNICRAAAMVAVVALAGAALYKFAKPDYKVVAYVDGRQITDKKLVKILAENTLDHGGLRHGHDPGGHRRRPRDGRNRVVLRRGPRLRRPAHGPPRHRCAPALPGVVRAVPGRAGLRRGALRERPGALRVPPVVTRSEGSRHHSTVSRLTAPDEDEPIARREDGGIRTSPGRRAPARGGPHRMSRSGALPVRDRGDE